MKSEPEAVKTGLSGFLGYQSCRGNLPRVPQAADYGPKLLNTIDSLQRYTTDEPYTPYQKITPPLQVEEVSPPT
jgi:hypothetical protein